MRCRLDNALDALASRTGIFLVVGLLVCVCVGSGSYVRTSITQLEEDHSVFRDRQVRNGYVAMSDMQRLILVAQRAVSAGSMTPELAREFIAATDIIYVRNDNFRRVLERASALDSGVSAISGLEVILEIADRSIAEDHPDNSALVEGLLAAAENTREHLVQFLDDMRRQADQVLDTQSLAVRKQQAIVIANLIALTLAGSVALLLLRREVLGRHAREKAEKRVAYLAYFDPLTELPNRTQFQERLQSWLNDRLTFALLFVDLDDFKSINDTYGHATGDAALRAVASMLSGHASRMNGFAARLGGDEFALVIPEDSIEQLTSLCVALLSQSSNRMEFEGETFEVGVSVGASTSAQVMETMFATLDSLCRVTDFALYTSKSEGGRRFTIYDQALGDKFLDRRAMIDELPHAIEQGLLEVYLQPKVELPEAETRGFEALVRWRRGEELIPPDSFIAVAEESGLVVEIDHYVLKCAVKEIADWNKMHGTGFSVSVNLAAVHFGSERIVAWVEEALWHSMLAPKLLTLEITETMVLKDWDKARMVIDQLKALGVRISIDDFGTGYSSIAYLHTMGADEIKIDRSLILQVESSGKSRRLLSSILDIARNLGLQVVVEGIETEGQARIVHEMGVLLVQGFLFGRPRPHALALRDFTGAEKTDPTRRAM